MIRSPFFTGFALVVNLQVLGRPGTGVAAGEERAVRSGHRAAPSAAASKERKRELRQNEIIELISMLGVLIENYRYVND